MNLQGKVAVVTGASAGIGRAYALALAGDGATVVAAARRLGGGEGESRDANTLASLVKTSETLPGRVCAHACDMEVEADIVRLVDQTIAEFGHIDVLVNNAGLLWQFDALNIAVEQWDRMMRTNVRGPYIAIRQTAPQALVAPALLVAATDSRHYQALTKNIFRFLPIILGPDDTKRYHGIDERIAIEDYERCVRFYAQLIRNSQP